MDPIEVEGERVEELQLLVVLKNFLLVEPA
jgi:hypothetical protein